MSEGGPLNDYGGRYASSYYAEKRPKYEKLRSSAEILEETATRVGLVAFGTLCLMAFTLNGVPEYLKHRVEKHGPIETKRRIIDVDENDYLTFTSKPYVVDANK